MKRFISVMLVFFMAAHAASQSQARMPEWSWYDSADLLTSFSSLPSLAAASYQVITESIYKTVTHPATGWIVGGLSALYSAYYFHTKKNIEERRCDFYRIDFITIGKKAGREAFFLREERRKNEDMLKALHFYQQRANIYRGIIAGLAPSMKLSLGKHEQEEKKLMVGITQRFVENELD